MSGKTSTKQAALGDLPDPPNGKTGWPWTEDENSLSESRSGRDANVPISIVTPSYNQGGFIEETIRSVLLQNYPNVEYIVVDGGSSDGTVEILEKYDPWIDAWVSEPDEGQSDAINKGFWQASGEVLAWLNSDDYYAPGALRTMAHSFAELGEEVGALVGTGHKVDGSGEIVYTPEVPELSYDAFLCWMDYGHFMQPACFFRRKAWEDAGPLRIDLRYPLDVDLWLKMIQRYRFERVEETIAYAHQHREAKTTEEYPQTRAETSLLIAEHGGWDIARRHLMDQAEELAKTQKKVRRVTSHPLYRIVRPFYKWLFR
jgi:hypothetical protein